MQVCPLPIGVKSVFPPNAEIEVPGIPDPIKGLLKGVPLTENATQYVPAGRSKLIPFAPNKTKGTDSFTSEARKIKVSVPLPLRTKIVSSSSRNV